jgi:hypothetical protein
LNSVEAIGGKFVKHRSIDYDVEEIEPRRWRWIIDPKKEDEPKVVGEAKFRTREAAVAACMEEINNGIERSNR